MVVLSWTIFQDWAFLLRRLAFHTERTYHSLGPCMVVLSWTIFQNGAVVPEKIGLWHRTHLPLSWPMYGCTQLDTIPRWLAVGPQRRLAFNIEHTYHSLDPCMVVLAVPRGCLWFVIVVFPDYTHLLLNTLTTISTHVWVYSVGQYIKMELLSLRRLAFHTEHTYRSVYPCMAVLSWTIF